MLLFDPVSRCGEYICVCVCIHVPIYVYIHTLTGLINETWAHVSKPT